RRVVLADPRLAEAELIGPAQLLEVPLVAVVEAALRRVRGHREQAVVHGVPPLASGMAAAYTSIYFAIGKSGWSYLTSYGARPDDDSSRVPRRRQPGPPEAARRAALRALHGLELRLGGGGPA